jgi:hypothetical protein
LTSRLRRYAQGERDSLSRQIPVTVNNPG